MKAAFLRPGIIPDSPPAIHLTPESLDDEIVLEAILSDYAPSVLGFGRHGETKSIIHMQIRLESVPVKPLRLVDRLRGIYTVAVDDGAGLLNGKDTFTRNFPTTPINLEAAKEIERLTGLIRNVIKGNWCVTDLQEAIGEISK